MNKFFKFLFLAFAFGLFSNLTFSQNQNLTAFVENSSDNKPIPSVHVINLSQVVGVITDKKGKFEIPAKLNDTLYLSYLGFKSIKVRVTNDLLKFKNSKIQLTELALRNCNFSDSFILTANDLQILDAISGCYEEFKVLNRK